LLWPEAAHYQNVTNRRVATGVRTDAIAYSVPIAGRLGVVGMFADRIRHGKSPSRSTAVKIASTRRLAAAAAGSKLRLPPPDRPRSPRAGFRARCYQP
jgi:hypothetical protein